MKAPPVVALLSLLSCFPLAASDGAGKDDISQCVKTTKTIFRHKNDRDSGMLDKYYAPEFRALIRKGVAAPPGEAPFLDADFLRLTQDTPPRIVKLGPARPGKDGKVSVPAAMRYTPITIRTNTAVFRMVGGRWLICDLVSDGESLAAQQRKEFGR